MKTILLLFAAAVFAVSGQVIDRGTYKFEFRSGRVGEQKAELSPKTRRTSDVPSYAVPMEPLPQYSQPDPLYLQKKAQEVGKDSSHSETGLLPRTDYDDYHHDPSYHDPEPIIEIIIKESNQSLPAPPPPPPAKKKKKEHVQVFFVKYRKDPDSHYGENKVIYESPVAAITPPTNTEEPHHQEEELHHQHHHEESVTYGPPKPSTTLKAIIKPDSEIYHGTGGLHITFGESKHEEGNYSPHLGDHHEQSAPQPAIAFPEKAPRASTAVKRNPEPFQVTSPPQQAFHSRSTFQQDFSRPTPLPTFQQVPQYPPQSFKLQSSQSLKSSPPRTYSTLPQSLQYRPQAGHHHFRLPTSQPTVEPQQQYHTINQQHVRQNVRPTQQYHTINHHRPVTQSTVRFPQPSPITPASTFLARNPLQQRPFESRPNFQEHQPQPARITNLQQTTTQQRQPPRQHINHQHQLQVHQQQIDQLTLIQQQQQYQHQKQLALQQQQQQQHALQQQQALHQQKQHALQQQQQIQPALPQKHQTPSILPQQHQIQPVLPQQHHTQPILPQQQQTQPVLQQQHHTQPILPQHQQKPSYQSNTETEIIKSISPEINFNTQEPVFPTQQTVYHQTQHPTYQQTQQPIYQQTQQPKFQQPQTYRPTVSNRIQYTTEKPQFQTTKSYVKYKSTTTQQPIEYVTEDPKKVEEERKKKEERKKQNVAALPDEVPDDLRQQLLSSGILGNADIQILDYDKIGDIPIESLPPEALANFQSVAGSEPVPAVAEDSLTSASELDEVHEMEMKVVRFDPGTKEGADLATTYLKEDATQLDPVVLNDSKYNRYLPLKVAGAQFPVPDVPELRGRNVTSVVVLAPVDYEFLQRKDNVTDATGRASEPVLEVQGVHFVAGDSLKALVKAPTADNYRKWLEKENKTSPDKQSVVLLVLEPLPGTPAGSKDIFMYDIGTRRVSKLRGELSATFVEVAESNSQNDDLEEISDSPSAPGGGSATVATGARRTRTADGSS